LLLVGEAEHEELDKCLALGLLLVTAAELFMALVVCLLFGTLLEGG
jgi:hypothetical protein